jgi:hypothetical protein
VNSVQEWGAFAFGAVIGWFTYFVNRHRTDEISIADVATIVGALGGAAVLALFPARSTLFGAYGLGLAAGFFGYFLLLVVLVRGAPRWTLEWFLDGRRPVLRAGQEESEDHPLTVPDPAGAVKD